MKKHSLLLIFCLFVLTNLFSQDSIPSKKDSLIEKIQIGAYLDAYYGFNSTQNSSHEIPYFVSMNRDNEFSINLAFIDFKYNSDKIRARFAPGFGSYMNSNYANEKNTFKNIVESSVGVKIHPKKEIWLDMGILGSPFTNETAISKDHIMYSRSLSAEYVPYYLCGIKLSLPLTSKLTSYFYLINGWQQIFDWNKSKSFGSQLEYKPDSKNLFNWDTYIGNERSIYTPNYKNRYFTDVYWTHNLNGKWSFSSCAYLGLQEIDSTKTENNVWFQANILARFRFSKKSSLSTRIEYFSDAQGIQMNSINPSYSGFSTLGFAIGYNLQISDKMLYRMEARSFFSEKEYFIEKNNFVNYSYWFLNSFVFYLNN
ncbi:MAG: outer membrane beta-barrel protein [Bacteroidota bacterium]